MRVGFVGLGDIGLPMAERLAETGFDLSVLDTDSNRAAALRSSGAKVAQSTSDLADCEVVGLAVPDDDAVRSVLIGDRLLELLPAGAAVLIHSTVLPRTAQELEAEGLRSGVLVADAPVSGGAARARSGDLAVVLGGSTDTVEKARKVLESLSSTVVHAGPAGAGAAVKLANQLAMLAALAAIQEGMALAAHHGADESCVLRALQAGTGDSWVARNWGFFDDLARSYNERDVPVKMRPWSKDLWDVVASAREADLRVPLGAALSQFLADAVEDHAAAAGSPQ
jgi:3-hydroxyisobutyrate dehydrogenase-like beta-hydroxyacid dehydrogenase